MIGARPPPPLLWKERSGGDKGADSNRQGEGGDGLVDADGSWRQRRRRKEEEGRPKEELENVRGTQAEIQNTLKSAMASTSNVVTRDLALS